MNNVFTNQDFNEAVEIGLEGTQGKVKMEKEVHSPGVQRRNTAAEEIWSPQPARCDLTIDPQVRSRCMIVKRMETLLLSTENSVVERAEMINLLKKWNETWRTAPSAVQMSKPIGKLYKESIIPMLDKKEKESHFSTLGALYAGGI